MGGVVPYVGILDPRTGELMKAWAGTAASASSAGITGAPPPMGTAEEFVGELKTFLEAYSLEMGARNPVLLDNTTTSTKGGSSTRKKKDVSKMSEEDQLEYALRQSLGKADSDYGDGEEDEEEEEGFVFAAPGDSDEEEFEEFEDADFEDFEDDTPPKKEEDVPAPKTDDKSIGTEAPADDDADGDDQEELTEEDLFALIEPDTSPEPPATLPPASVTRIQFRMANGSRQIRRFLVSDTVRKLFAVVKAIEPSAKYSFFELTSERKKLNGMMDETIEGAGLKNSSVLVEILD